MFPLTPCAALITLPMAHWALVLNGVNQPTFAHHFQVIPSSMRLGTACIRRNPELRCNRSLRSRSFYANKHLGVDHLQCSRAAIPMAASRKEPLAILSAVCQHSLFLGYAGTKELPHKFFDRFHKQIMYSKTNSALLTLGTE